MDLSPGEIVGIVTGVLAIGATYGITTSKVKHSDEKIATVQKDLSEKLEAIRTDQGRRIGGLEDRVSKLEGFAMGQRHRRKTEPRGEPTK